jgi:outer membrane protein assembly factor BamB
VDYSHKHIINPKAPALIVLDRKTGMLVGEEASGISQRIMHCNWSSPAAGQVNGVGRIFFGAGDGFCYGFAPAPVPDDEGYGILKERWRFDCNPPPYRAKDGQRIKYGKPAGPSEIIATPVFHDGRVYVAIGQDPEHGEGLGALSCIDATVVGEDSRRRLVWQYTDINRSISTVSIADGLLYAADYAGMVHCLDAKTGDLYWKHDTLGHIWGSTLVADGKVLVGNEDGYLTILKAGKEKTVLGNIEFSGPIYASPVFANGTLYVTTMMHLYAIQGP